MEGGEALDIKSAVPNGLGGFQLYDLNGTDRPAPLGVAGGSRH